MVYATVTFYCVTLVRAATVSYMTPCRHMHTWHMCTPTNLKVDELQAEGGWTEAVEALRTDGANKTLGGGVALNSFCLRTTGTKYYPTGIQLN